MRDCCQGDDGQQAYASLQGSGSLPFLFAMAEIMARTFAIHGTKVTVGEQMYAHNFIIEIGEAMVMRWPPLTYPLVLQAAKEASEHMGSGGR